MRAALVWCPCPHAEVAKKIAENLLAEKLIACGNIIPGVESVFEWNDECTTAQEVAVVFKTTDDKLEELVQRLGELHPYDTPAILGWACDSAHPATMAWLNGTLHQE